MIYQQLFIDVGCIFLHNLPSKLFDQSHSEESIGLWVRDANNKARLVKHLGKFEAIDATFVAVCRKIMETPDPFIRNGMGMKIVVHSIETVSIYGMLVSRVAVFGLHGHLLITVTALTPLVSYLLTYAAEHYKPEKMNMMKNVTLYLEYARFLIVIYSFIAYFYTTLSWASALQFALTILLGPLSVHVSDQIALNTKYSDLEDIIKIWVSHYAGDFSRFESSPGFTDYPKFLNELLKLMDLEDSFKLNRENVPFSKFKDACDNAITTLDRSLSTNEYVQTLRYLMHLKDTIAPNR